MFVNMALHEHSRNIGVETHCKEHGCEVECLLADDARGIGDGEGMEVHDAVKDVSIVLARHPINERAQMVAEMD